MLFVASVIALLCCILCLDNTMNKTAGRFEKVFFSIMSVLFLILCVIIQVGVWG